MRAAVALAVVLAGCGRYADFSLPDPGQPQAAVSGIGWDVSAQPVLARGKPDEWDAVDALNPTIVARGGTLFNFYSGFDGKTWHTGLATSTDGYAWTKLGKILSPGPAAWEGSYIAANGAAIFHEGRFYYWYQAGDPPRIGLARSSDGRAWVKEPSPVLAAGPRGSWDERATADPYVVARDGRLYMFYLGEDRARRQRLGMARSRDGVVWEKLRTNPILELGGTGAFDENGLGEPAVWNSHGRWWMLYTGRDRSEARRLGLAWSDGATWKRFSEAPVLEGAHPWMSRVVCDPHVELAPQGIRVWFGGGDVAHPAENVHGQIGHAMLTIR